MHYRIFKSGIRQINLAYLSRCISIKNFTSNLYCIRKEGFIDNIGIIGCDIVSSSLKGFDTLFTASVNLYTLFWKSAVCDKLYNVIVIAACKSTV